MEIKSIPSNSQTSKKNYTISIEGNIGCGKSYLIDFLKNKKDLDFDFFPEPVEKWKNLEGDNLLDDFYKLGNAFHLQTYIAITLAEIKEIKSSKIKVTERSLESGLNIFTTLAFRNNLLTKIEYNILNNLYSLIGDSKIDEIIYLKSSPKLCLSRLQKRDRSEESKIKIEYLNSINDLYENWIKNLNIKVTVIDQDKNDISDFEDLANTLQTLHFRSLG